MIYNREYFVRGAVEGALVVEERNYYGEVTDTRSFIGDTKGEYLLTLAWEGGRESKRFTDFGKALRMSNGYWAKAAIWHILPNGKRKRVIRWQ